MTGIGGQCVWSSRRIEIHILEADPRGNGAVACAGLPCRLIVLLERDPGDAKRDPVRKPDTDRTVCIGNGRNDRLMVRDAVIGIVVIGKEGASAETAAAAHVVCRSAGEALSLLVNTMRLVATLRS